MSWTNYSGDQACAPAGIERPRSVEELTAVVKSAAAAGRTVRAVGAGHSFSPVVPTDGVLVSLDGLHGLQHVDEESGLVRVAAGTRLHALNPMLAERGLALPNLGDIDLQSRRGLHGDARHRRPAGEPVHADRVARPGPRRRLGAHDQRG